LLLPRGINCTTVLLSLDIFTAFDTIDHNILLDHILREFSIRVTVTTLGCLGGVRSSDLRSSGRGFDSRWDAIKLNSAFHPSGVGKSSTGLVGWGYGGARSLVSGDR